MQQLWGLCSRQYYSIANCVHFPLNVIYTYLVGRYGLSHNGPQFLGNFFTELCSNFHYRTLETSAYHLRTSRQPSRSSKNIAWRFPHYLAEGQSDWHTFLSEILGLEQSGPSFHARHGISCDAYATASRCIHDKPAIGLTQRERDGKSNRKIATEKATAIEVHELEKFA